MCVCVHEVRTVFSLIKIVEMAMKISMTDKAGASDDSADWTARASVAVALCLCIEEEIEKGVQRQGPTITRAKLIKMDTDSLGKIDTLT